MGSQFLQQNDSREAKIAEQSDKLHPHQDRASPCARPFYPMHGNWGLFPYGLITMQILVRDPTSPRWLQSASHLVLVQPKLSCSYFILLIYLLGGFTFSQLSICSQTPIFKSSAVLSVCRKANLGLSEPENRWADCSMNGNLCLREDEKYHIHSLAGLQQGQWFSQQWGSKQGVGTRLVYMRYLPCQEGTRRAPAVCRESLHLANLINLSWIQQPPTAVAAGWLLSCYLHILPRGNVPKSIKARPCFINWSHPEPFSPAVSQHQIPKGIFPKTSKRQ